MEDKIYSPWRFVVGFILPGMTAYLLAFSLVSFERYYFGRLAINSINPKNIYLIKGKNESDLTCLNMAFLCPTDTSRIIEEIELGNGSPGAVAKRLSLESYPLWIEIDSTHLFQKVVYVPNDGNNAEVYFIYSKGFKYYPNKGLISARPPKPGRSYDESLFSFAQLSLNPSPVSFSSYLPIHTKISPWTSNPDLPFPYMIIASLSYSLAFFRAKNQRSYKHLTIAGGLALFLTFIVSLTQY